MTALDITMIHYGSSGSCRGPFHKIDVKVRTMVASKRNLERPVCIVI